VAGRGDAPKIAVTVAACEYQEWRRFAPYHYLTADLNKIARTFCAYVDGQPVAFAGLLFRPLGHRAKAGDLPYLMGICRGVVLPDWLGCGVIFALIDTVAAAYAAAGARVNSYPAHPSLIRSCDRSPVWALTGRPGFTGQSRAASQSGRANMAAGKGDGSGSRRHKVGPTWNQGNRPNATFTYVGPALARSDAESLLGPYLTDELRRRLEP
jgi:hypothetical protein